MSLLDLRVLVISDRSLFGGDLSAMLDALGAVLRGGATALMLREKDLPAEQMIPLAMRIREMTRAAGAVFVVNHDLEAARASGADAAHLGWQSATVPDARANLGNSAAIGMSTHSVRELLDARDAGVDYATFSPVWPTPSKEGLVEVQGVDALAEAARSVDMPVLALGGVDESNAARAIRAGAAGVAAIRGVLAAPDPQGAAERVRAEVDLALSER